MLICGCKHGDGANSGKAPCRVHASCSSAHKVTLIFMRGCGPEWSLATTGRQLQVHDATRQQYRQGRPRSHCHNHMIPHSPTNHRPAPSSRGTSTWRGVTAAGGRGGVLASSADVAPAAPVTAVRLEAVGRGAQRSEKCEKRSSCCAVVPRDAAACTHAHEHTRTMCKIPRYDGRPCTAQGKAPSVQCFLVP